MEKRFLEKLKLNRGESYVTKSGIARCGKSLREPCNENDCRFRCAQRISHEDRMNIFGQYYALGDKNQQWQYIAKNLERITPKYRRRNHGNRQCNIAYGFTINGQRERVCKLFFSNTLCITGNVCTTALKKCDTNGVLLERDKRGGGYGKRLIPTQASVTNRKF